MEDRGSTDDKMSGQMWEEVEDRKTNKTRMEETGREGEKEGNEETNNRGINSNSKNSGRKGGRVR